MKRIQSPLPLLLSFALAGVLTASLATGTAQSAVASLVQIVNTAANPVPMQDMDNPARQPVTILTSIHVSANAANGYVEPAYQVPVGKMLVIEYIGASTTVIAPEHVFSVTLFDSNNSTYAYAPVVDLGTDSTNANLHAVMASQSVAMYVGPGDSVNIGVQTNAASSGVGSMPVQVTGYLVDLP
ncbi:MAG TPA: hypothetical protein VMR31_07730 [Myxococcota bacterium]|nr:hypothetical protein [Myxococcota bacterium]